MALWTDMYYHFPDLMTYGQEGAAYRDFNGCQTLPTGPQAQSCPEPFVCIIECLVPYYMSLKGLEYQLDWHWEYEILR